jgi:hypothetical protein
MNNAHENNHLHPEAAPADVRDIAGRLDALASRDRAAAPAGFEDRLLAATRSGLAARQGTVAGVIHARGPWSGLKLAASLAIVGGIGLLGAVYVLGSRNQAPQAPTGQLAQAQPEVLPGPNTTAEDPLDVDAISAEFEEYLASVKGTSSDLTDGSDVSSGDGFWDVGNALTLEGSL